MTQLKNVFDMIGTDYACATRKGDSHKQRALIALVVALEHAYPSQMANLRRNHPQLDDTALPPLQDAAPPGGVPVEAFVSVATQRYLDALACADKCRDNNKVKP